MNLGLLSHHPLDTESIHPSLSTPAPPVHSYIIASTNRTGSYLLCEGLRESGIAGFPTESLYPEYRDDLCLRRYGEVLDLSDSIRALIRHESTPNGVFGAKVHWDQVENIAYESGYDGPPHAFLLKELPDARYIHISRRDTKSQAISLSIALQTGAWWQLSDERKSLQKTISPIFDAAEILRLEQDLIRQENAWEAFFQLEGIAPLRMEYETLIADYRGEVARALAFLGLDAAVASNLPEPKMQKQGGKLNDLWLSWLQPNVTERAVAEANHAS